MRAPDPNDTRNPPTPPQNPHQNPPTHMCRIFAMAPPCGVTYRSCLLVSHNRTALMLHHHARHAIAAAIVPRVFRRAYIICSHAKYARVLYNIYLKATQRASPLFCEANVYHKSVHYMHINHIHLHRVSQHTYAHSVCKKSMEICYAVFEECAMQTPYLNGVNIMHSAMQGVSFQDYNTYEWARIYINHILCTPWCAMRGKIQTIQIAPICKARMWINGCLLCVLWWVWRCCWPNRICVSPEGRFLA